MIFDINKVVLAVLTIGEMVFLSACGVTFDYEALRRNEYAGQEFGAALARAYQELALFEADLMYDWADAASYGEKSLAAGNGEVVRPGRIEDRDLPAAMRPRLAAARRRLTAALGKGAADQWPLVAADAQAGFDCWLEQQEENFQFDHIAGCRNRFLGAIAQLESAQFEITMAAKSGRARPAGLRKTMAAKQVRAVAPVPTGAAAILHFGFDSAGLDTAAAAVLDRAAAAYRSGAPVTIMLNGHTDRAGPATYNRALSRRRSEAARRALIERGIPIQLISVYAFGEDRPRIKTADGVREPRNRRVEIRFASSNNL